MEDNDMRWVLGGLILLAVAGGAWLFRDLLLPPEPAPVAAPAATEPPSPAPKSLEPLHPVEPIEPRGEGGTLVPLPDLDESDEYFAMALEDAFGDSLVELLAADLLIERTVGTVDSLGRGRVPERIRPVGRLPGSFQVDGTGGDAGYTLSTRNYARYDDIVRTLETADLATLVDTYRRFYPLMQEAYQLLGYPNGHFNDRVIEVLDLLLETPSPSGPVELKREHVLYEYRDPALEDLAAGQKILIRMGPENAARVRPVLEALRRELASPTRD